MPFAQAFGSSRARGPAPSFRRDPGSRRLSRTVFDQLGRCGARVLNELSTSFRVCATDATIQYETVLQAALGAPGAGTFGDSGREEGEAGRSARKHPSRGGRRAPRGRRAERETRKTTVKARATDARRDRGRRARRGDVDDSFHPIAPKLNRRRAATTARAPAWRARAKRTPPTAATSPATSVRAPWFCCSCRVMRPQTSRATIAVTFIVKNVTEAEKDERPAARTAGTQ